MTKLLENTCNAIANINRGEALSKVTGRKNWVIMLENGKIRYANGYGHAKENGMTKAPLRDIAQFNITWIYFTYKRDFLAMVEKLKSKGFTIGKNVRSDFFASSIN